MERIESPAYARLGNSGLVVPSVGIGCNNLGRPGTPTQTQEGTNAVIAAAVEAGIGFFDIADLYGAEPRAFRNPCSVPRCANSTSTAMT